MAFSASAAVSSNIVGYVKLTLSRGYNLISNPLNNTNPDGNKVGTLFKSLDCNISRWTGSGFAVSSIFADVGVVEGDDFVLNPGEAVFIEVDAEKSVTLVGEALIGTQSVPVIRGNNFVASKIPLGGTVTQLGLVPGDGDTVAKWAGTKYTTYDYFAGTWLLDGVPAEPTVAVGEGVVLNSLAPFSWTLTFTPAP
jgi:hypothetical protein